MSRTVENDRNDRCHQNIEPKELNVIVMTDAGKIIFHRYDNNEDNEENLVCMCSFIQAMRATALHDPSLGNGDIQYINRTKSKIVFVSVGCITLVAIAKKVKDVEDMYFDFYNEAYLRLLLEYMYSIIVFALTDSVQYMLNENPRLDLRELLGSSTNVMKSVLNDMTIDNYAQNERMLSSVSVFGPVPFEVRDFTSKILCKICSKHKSIVYAILSVNSKLFNIIQPQVKQYQFQSCDLNILLQIISSQTLLSSSDNNALWFPICLPGLSQSGFVHGYQCTLGIDELNLTIISQDPSIEEFQRMQAVADEIRIDLGLIPPNEQTLRIYDLSQKREKKQSLQPSGTNDNNLVWERISDDTNCDHSDETCDIHRKRYGCVLIRSIKKALIPEYQEEIFEGYCDLASVIHFVFCTSALIRDCHSGSTSGGHLEQYCSPKMNFKDTIKKEIWNAYQKLGLRLRIGSTSVQSTMKALDDILFTQGNNDHNSTNLCRPSQILHEKVATEQGISYFIHGEYLFLGLSGKNYDFYATLSVTVPPLDANTLCGVLLDTLIHDMNDLFQCKPQSF
mmetsp:Transcript_24063/g.27464  ORF Transcript_24063/g.27464 Transcript_24063/m.27464 type:complete len:564 (-) Transcript_24063:28-1719(-)